jgi:hypothetical protein
MRHPEGAWPWRPSMNNLPGSNPLVYIDGVTDTLIIITLLVKLGVAAAVASALARSRTFQRLLFAEHRNHGQTAALLAFFLVPLTLGVWVRTKVPNFLAADISFETVILLGLLVGPGWAMLGGVVLSVPAVCTMSTWRCPSTPRWGWLPACSAALSRWTRSGPSRPSST